MRTIETVFGTVDQSELKLGDAEVFINRHHEPPHAELPERMYTWDIREPRAKSQERAKRTGAPSFRHVHNSKLKCDRSFESYGRTLIHAIEYLNTGRRKGIL